MRAMQIVAETGPDSALELVELPEPEPSHMLTPGSGVLVEVQAAGVSFPELLQTRGQYQMKPPLPFVPGSEVAGIVRSAPADAAVKEGDRVAAFCALGGFAEVAVAPDFFTFPLPDELDFAQGAGLILNYHTAYFALALRGRLKEGETRARARRRPAASAPPRCRSPRRSARARSRSSPARRRRASPSRRARTRSCCSARTGREEVKERSGGGVDVVLDPVGGDRFTDSLRSLREDGRLVVVGFTGGSIPEVRVNRLLLGNTEVVGAGWGAYVMGKPDLCMRIGAAIADMIAAGHVRPLVGASFPLARAGDALKTLEERRATGKIVLDVRG